MKARLAALTLALIGSLPTVALANRHLPYGESPDYGQSQSFGQTSASPVAPDIPVPKGDASDYPINAGVAAAQQGRRSPPAVAAGRLPQPLDGSLYKPN